VVFKVGGMALGGDFEEQWGEKNKWGNGRE